MSIGSIMLQMNNNRVVSGGWTGTTTGLQLNLFSAPTSGTTWTDISGNNRNATLQGSASYVSTNGGGVKLNNASYTGTDYISAPYNIPTNTATVEVIASFNPTSYWATIFGNEIYNTSAGYFAYLSGSTSLIYGKPGGSSSLKTITASNAVRQWIFVFNGTSTKVYLNGSQLSTTDFVTAQTLFASSEILFGARHTNGGTGATDKMNNSNSSLYPVFYQMRVYNIALNDSQITANYNAVKTTYGI